MIADAAPSYSLDFFYMCVCVKQALPCIHVYKGVHICSKMRRDERSEYLGAGFCFDGRVIKPFFPALFCTASNLKYQDISICMHTQHTLRLHAYLLCHEVPEVPASYIQLRHHQRVGWEQKIHRNQITEHQTYTYPNTPIHPTTSTTPSNPLHQCWCTK